MGYNNDNAARVVFDIETCPLPDAAEFLEPVDAPANYKDPLKIAAFIAEKQAEQVERAGLDLDLCQIVAVGMWQETSSGPVSLTREDCDEEGLIRDLWRFCLDRHLVGFNCLAFDLPVLIRRSQYLGIPVPNLQIDKYKHPQVTDLAQVLSFNGAVRMRSLAFYAKRFGIPCADTMKGSDIAQAVADGRWQAIREHVEADVVKTGQLGSKLGHFSLATETVL